MNEYAEVNNYIKGSNSRNNIKITESSLLNIAEQTNPTNHGLALSGTTQKPQDIK